MNRSSSPKFVLVVDDDPVQIKLMDKLLTDNGYKVMTATEAANGLNMAMHSHPDLIILDVMMPIINGYNFCKLLKSEEKKRHIPVILLTSRDEKEDVEIGMEMGANAYLTKPIDTDELLKTIRFVANLSSKV